MSDNPTQENCRHNEGTWRGPDGLKVCFGCIRRRFNGPRLIVGVFCNRCNLVLAPHTAAAHLDKDNPIHDCGTGHEVVA